LNSKTKEILAKHYEGQGCCMEMLEQEVDCRVRGIFGLWSQFGSMVEQHMIERKVVNKPGVPFGF
jgi:hypothetical protein